MLPAAVWLFLRGHRRSAAVCSVGSFVWQLRQADAGTCHWALGLCGDVSSTQCKYHILGCIPMIYQLWLVQSSLRKPAGRPGWSSCRERSELRGGGRAREAENESPLVPSWRGLREDPEIWDQWQDIPGERKKQLVARRGHEKPRWW